MSSAPHGRPVRLAQIVAVVKGVKTRHNETLTRIYHEIQKPALLSGLSRTYQPRDEDGDPRPPESVGVQVFVEDSLKRSADALTRLIDITATLDATNTHAHADIVVDGVTLASDVPAVTLLALEKQFQDFHTLISKLPVLDPAERWQQSPSMGGWETVPSQTFSTKKVPRNHLKAPATDKHPAQVEVYYDDVPVGTWTLVKFSGAIPARRKQELLQRVDKLLEAIKFAREDANNTAAVDVSIGESLTGYMLSDSEPSTV